MEDELDIRDYLELTKRHWKLAIAIFLAVFLAAAVYTTVAPRIYEASSQVLISGQDQMSYLMGSPSYKMDIETQKAIVLSSSVLSAVNYPVDEFEIDVDSPRDSDVLIITIQSADPDKAMMIANSVAESYVKYSQESRISSAVELNKFINRQLKEYKAELNELNTELLVYENEKGNYQDDLKNINTIIDDYRNKNDVCQQELEVLKNQLSDFEGNTSAPAYMNLTQSIADKTAECSMLSARYSGFLSKQMKLINSTGIAGEIKYKGLIQAIKAKEDIYDSLLSKSEEISIIAQENSGNVNIIEYAEMPIAPAKPNILLDLAIGFVLAAFAALGTVFISGSMRNTFRNPKDIGAEIGPVIGYFPRLRQNTNNPLAHYRVFDEHPDDAASEHIRMLRASIPAENQLISITSPQKGDGKSVVASNLAIAYASSGKKVLIVDSNPKNPILHRLFRLDRNTSGLYDFMLDDTKLSRIIKVRETQYKNLYILPAGLSRKLKKTRELLSDEKIKRICKKFNESDFDIIIFDNSSLEYAESTVISANCGSVLLVIDLERTSRELAAEAKETLAKRGARITGVVVNRR